MATFKYPPRLNLDRPILESKAGHLQRIPGQIRQSLEKIRTEPDKLPQTRHSSLAMEYRFAGFELYALGHPLEEVRDAFASAALAGLMVAQLRCEEPLHTVTVTLDPRYPPSDPRHAVEEPMHPGEAKDYTLGNSRKNFWYVTAALTAGEFGIAHRVAALAGDPPDADWVNLRSFCTPNDQRIAYAVRHLFAEEKEKTLAELDRIRPNKLESETADHASVARMIRALALNEADAFVLGLNSLLRWHEHAFTEQFAVNFYINLPGTGLSALGLRRGLITRDQLPDDSPYLPLGLLDLALERASDEVRAEFRIFDFPE
jgi:hypothetical protein